MFAQVIGIAIGIDGGWSEAQEAAASAAASRTTGCIHSARTNAQIDGVGGTGIGGLLIVLA